MFTVTAGDMKLDIWMLFLKSRNNLSLYNMYQTGITLQVNTSLMSLLISFNMFGHFGFNLQDVTGEVDKYLSSIGGEQCIMFAGK